MYVYVERERASRVYIYIHIANRNAMNYIQLLRLHLLCFMQMPLLLAVVLVRRNDLKQVDGIYCTGSLRA